MFLFLIVNYWLCLLISVVARIDIYNFHWSCSCLQYISLLNLSSLDVLYWKRKEKQVKEIKAYLCYCLQIWTAKIVKLPIHWKEFSHFSITQWDSLSCGKTLHTANSSVIYTFIAHFPNHLFPWEIQKFSYASLIHSRCASLQRVFQKTKILQNEKNNCIHLHIYYNVILSYFITSNFLVAYGMLSTF